MTTTYKKLDDDTVEITITREEKIIVKKAELEARKAAILNADTTDLDNLLAVLSK